MPGKEQRAQIALAARKDSSVDKSFNEVKEKFKELQESAKEAGEGFGEFGQKILELAGVTYVFDQIKEGIDSLIESWGELTNVGVDVLQQQANLITSLQSQNWAMKQGTEFIQEQANAYKELAENQKTLQTAGTERAIVGEAAHLRVRPKGMERLLPAVNDYLATQPKALTDPETAKTMGTAVTEALAKASATGKTQKLFELIPSIKDQGDHLKIHTAKKGGTLSVKDQSENFDKLLTLFANQYKGAEGRVDPSVKSIAELNKAQEKVTEDAAAAALKITGDFDKLKTELIDHFEPALKSLTEQIGPWADNLSTKLQPLIPRLEALGDSITKLFSGTGTDSFSSLILGAATSFVETLERARENWKEVAEGVGAMIAGAAGLKVFFSADKFITELAHTAAMKEHSAALLAASGKGLISTGEKGGVFGEVVNAGKSAAGTYLAAQAAVVGTLVLPAILATELHKHFGILGITGQESKRAVSGEGGAAKADTNPLFETSRQHAEKIRDKLSEAKDKATDTTSEVSKWPSIAAQVSSALQTAMTGLANLAQANVYNKLNASPSSVPPKGSVSAASRYATGGIVNRPTLGLVGESGPESIIPLTGNKSRSWGLLASTMQALGVRGSGEAGSGASSVSLGGINVTITGNASAADATSIADTITETVMERIQDHISNNRSRLLAA